MIDLPGPLVDEAWLSDLLRRAPAAVRIVDVRWSIDDGPMRAAYVDGHLPGAVFADLDVDLSDPPGERGRHPLPTAARFAAVRRRLGIDRPVVAYDQGGGAVAARLWWMLDAIGLPAAVLDGGIGAWTGPLGAGNVDHSSTQSPEPVPWPSDRVIDAAEVPDAITNGALLLDARSADRFAGQPNPIDRRPGHIPGSVSRPWSDNVGDDGRLRSAEELRDQLAEQGADDRREVIVSCGSGVTACHHLLAARVAGLPAGRLYVGSWSEWSLDPDRPVATGIP